MLITLYALPIVYSIYTLTFASRQSQTTLPDARRKRVTMITTAQVNFMIQSAMIIQNVSKLKATETVNKYIKEKGWKIV